MTFIREQSGRFRSNAEDHGRASGARRERHRCSLHENDKLIGMIAVADTIKEDSP